MLALLPYCTVLALLALLADARRSDRDTGPPMGAADNDPLLTGAWGFLEVLRVFLSVFLIFSFFSSQLDGLSGGFSLENWMIDSIRCLTSVLMVYIFFFFFLFVIMVALIVFSIEHVLRMLGIYVFEWTRIF